MTYSAWRLAPAIAFSLFAFMACDKPDHSSVDDATPDVKASEVTYEGGGVTMNGYLAYDAAAEGARPGVLVVHEWWGLNDYARSRAEMLAGMGYTALAIDMYGAGRTADHPQGAAALSQEVAENMDSAVERFEAAMDLLKGHQTTDPDQLAAIGYCFGGGVVLQMARSGKVLDGVVSFHGSLGPPENPTAEGVVQTPMLILVGDSDPFIPMDQLEAFKADLDQAAAPYEVVVYENVQHSFTNPGADSVGKKFELPLVYDEEADKASWAAMQTFFEEIFAD